MDTGKEQVNPVMPQAPRKNLEQSWHLPTHCIISALQEAWKNTAFAYELGKCLVAAKKKEREHLLQEPRCNGFR